MRRFEITFQDGRWLVNGKRLSELNINEKKSLDDFFRRAKMIHELHSGSDSRTYSRVRNSGLCGDQKQVESSIQ